MKGKQAWALLSIISILCSCKQQDALFDKVSSSRSGISFTNKLEDRPLFNILYYLYYYNGGGVATGDINNDGLTDIYFTANSKGNNRLYLNRGNLEFEDVTAKAGVSGTSDWCSGVTMADINGDGRLDIYVSAVSNSFGLNGHNLVYINNGNNTFTESAARLGLDFSGLSTQAGFFDYDHDGDLDCFLLNHSKKPHANIVDTVNRRVYDSISGDRLYRNDINVSGRFTDVSAQAGIYQSNLGYGLGLAIADINNDGWDDVYVGNDFHENDYYYINNGNGTFTESSASHFRHYSRFSMGNDVADYNNDGHLDVVTVDMLPPDEKILKTYGSDENPDIYKVKLERRGYQHQYSRNCLQRNNGDGISFSDVGLMSGISATDWSWAPLFADFNNDGKKDLFISSGIVKRPVDLDYIRFVSHLEMQKGMNSTDAFDKEAIEKMPDGSSMPFLFRGDGSGNFKDVSSDWGTGNMKGFFNGAAYADLDNDGDLDLVMNCINSEAVLMENNSTGKNWLSVTCRGSMSNKFGIGAKLYLFHNGTKQYQQLMPTRGFQSSVDPRLHFGLDSLAGIDSVLVVWPDQRYQVLKNLPVNKPLTLNAADASGYFDHASFFTTQQPVFTEIAGRLNWQHRENNFLDYNIQYLIPHAQSTRGPKMAVADVNGDGYDDFYACGARNQPGTLFIQQADGRFVSTDEAVFAADAICEDVDAVFFDANNDKKADLLVISGGNEVPPSSRSLEDRLYINDGAGHFTRAVMPFTQQYENKSCVTVADVDKDGDEDFFVGNLAGPTSYGLARNSYLYINNGNAQFALAKNMIELNAIGMVTDAAFSDLNNDGWQDLVVVGEWMGIKTFINDKGTFRSSEIPSSTGLWQTVFPADVNGDGHIDLLAGNWGHNTKLYAGKNGPCKLYVKDFDNNGTIEQVMAYTIDGNEYTFLAKDELERALPVLKKAYLTYSEVAGKTVQYMFYDLFKDYTELTAEILSSSCFIGDGKGGFTRNTLPGELQMAPVMAFSSSGAQNGSFLAAGNFYGVIPYEGRYDALMPSVFGYEKGKNEFVIQTTIPSVSGEARDIKWLRTRDGGILVIAMNNASPVFFRKNKMVNAIAKTK